MSVGNISRLFWERGFGFIVEDGRREEIEFHWSAVQTRDLDQLREGQRVEFESRPDHRNEGRLRAVNVRIVGADDSPCN